MPAPTGLQVPSLVSNKPPDDLALPKLAAPVQNEGPTEFGLTKDYKSGKPIKFEEGLAPPDWDLVWTMTMALTGGAGMTGLLGGPLKRGLMALPEFAPSTVGAIGGAAGDVAYQVAHNIVDGLPWYMSLPAEIAASAFVASKASKGARSLIEHFSTPRAAEEAAAPVAEAVTPKAATPEAPPSPGLGPIVRPPTPLGLPAVGETEPWSHGPPSTYIGGEPVWEPQGVKQVYRGNYGVRAPEPPSGRFSEAVPRRSSDVIRRWQTLSEIEPTIDVEARRLGSPPETLYPQAKPTEGPVVEANPRVIEPPPAPPKVEPPVVAPRPGVEPGAPSSGQNVMDDVRGWRGSVNALNYTIGRAISPVLSQIERAAGPVVGKEITAMEGAQAARAQQVWGEIFQPLIDRLKALPKNLHENFIDTLEGKDTPDSALVSNTVQAFRQVFGTQGTAVKAQQALGLAVDPIENYFMHEFSPAFVRGLLNDPERVTALQQRMVDQGVATSVKEARSMIQSFMSRPGRSVFRDRPTGAEFDRVGMEDWIRDPVQAVFQRGRAISRRVAEREIYGPENINLRKLVDQLSGPAHDKTLDLLKLTMGRNPIDEGVSNLINRIMSIQATTSLSLSGVMNMTQPSLLALRTSLPNMAKALFKTVASVPSSYQAARRLGVYSDLAMRQLQNDLTGGSTNYLGRIAMGVFNVTEKFVRMVVVNAGEDWARTIQKGLQGFEQMSPKAQSVFQRELQNLNFTAPERARLLMTKALTPNDVKLIEWSLADQVAFMPRAARKSEFFLKTDVGPLILQFKGFLENAGRLLKTTLFDEARAGNWKPLIRAALVLYPTFALLGEIPNDLSTAIRGGRRPPVNSVGDLVLRSVDNVTQIGALGMGMSLIQEIAGMTPSGKGNLAQALAGPFITSLTQETQHPLGALKAFANQDYPEMNRQLYETGRRAVRRIPYAGPWIANQEMPPSNQSILDATDNLWDRLGITQKARDKEQLRQMQQRLNHLYQSVRPRL